MDQRELFFRTHLHRARAMHMFSHGMQGGHGGLGLIESFLYGAYIGIVFVPIYDFIDREGGLGEGG